jgi:ERCC4-type nuclease
LFLLPARSLLILREQKLVAPRITEQLVKYQNQARDLGATLLAESKSLTLGDYLWVARHRETGQEVLLDCIAERKTCVDMIASYMPSSGHKQRYMHQKRRIMESGAT